MTIALIANNPDITTFPDADLYVHFNSAIHWGKTDPAKSAIAVRKAWTVDEAKSWRPYPNTKNCDRIIAVGRMRDVESLVDMGIDDCHWSIAIDGVPYPVGQSPTSGYALIDWYMDLNEVIIVGFDLTKASYYKTSRIHDIEFEIEAVQQMVEQGLIRRHEDSSDM